jgi:hypothetical protein
MRVLTLWPGPGMDSSVHMACSKTEFRELTPANLHISHEWQDLSTNKKNGVEMQIQHLN